MAERGGVREALGARGEARGKGGKLGRLDAAWSAEELAERAAHAEKRAHCERTASSTWPRAPRRRAAHRQRAPRPAREPARYALCSRFGNGTTQGREDRRMSLKRLTAAELMTEAPITIDPDQTLRSAARLMTEKHLHCLLVPAEPGRVVASSRRKTSFRCCARARSSCSISYA